MSDEAILKAIAACNPNQALEPGDPRFVDFDSIRGINIRKHVLRLLQAAEWDERDQFAKIVVVGHRGSGKSTELNRTAHELENHGYVILWASVNENLDPRNISFSDVIRLLISLIDTSFGDRVKEHPSVGQAFRVVRDWFQERTSRFTEEIKEAKNVALRGRIGGAAEAEGSVGVASFKTDLGEMSAAISVLRQSESQRSTEIKETLERYNNQLVDNVNLLLRAVSVHLCAGRKLVFILDNVDKYEPEVVNQAFLRHDDLLRQLESHLIFTLQSSLLYDPVENAIGQHFKELILPMLPVFQRRTRTTDATVAKQIGEAVFKRVPRELFSDPEAAIGELVPSSGGCWRDLLRLLVEALLNTARCISVEDIRKARQLVALSYQRLLRGEEDLRCLAEAHVRHETLSTENARYLLHHLCILFYNGEGWYDSHPLLDSFDPLKKAIHDARKVQ